MAHFRALDPTLSERDVAEYRRQRCRDVVLDLLARQKRLRRPTLSQALTLDRKADAIDRAWAGVRDYIRAAPTPETVRLLQFFLEVESPAVRAFAPQAEAVGGLASRGPAPADSGAARPGPASEGR